MGRAYTWGDVAAYAAATGLWDAIVGAASAKASADAAAVSDADVDQAALAFRRDRGLVSADELTAWLDRRGITAHDWLTWTRRSLAAPGSGHETADDRAAWTEAMCSGVLDGLAVRLATLRAVSPDAPDADLEQAYEAFAREAASDAGILREAAAARLDWLRIEFATASFDDDDSAAEALLCVREDGEPLADVAARAGASVAEHHAWMEEVDTRLGPLLVAARPGEVLGPLAIDEQIVIAELRGKTSVDVDDPAIRARAASLLAERAAARVVTERVVWHDEP